MAEAGVAIAAARLYTLEALVSHMGGILAGTGFPVPGLRLKGALENKLEALPALGVEDWFKGELEAARASDMITGGCAIGAHRTDLDVEFGAKGMAAALCSTGEQKALLTAVVLAHAVRTRDLRDMPPILLLDEVAAHFDAARRAALFGVLGEIGAQVFITGTDYSTFSGMAGARYVQVGNGANLMQVAA